MNDIHYKAFKHKHQERVKKHTKRETKAKSTQCNTKCYSSTDRKAGRIESEMKSLENLELIIRIRNKLVAMDWP
jgi:hypothetical protein